MRCVTLIVYFLPLITYAQQRVVKTYYQGPSAIREEYQTSIKDTSIFDGYYIEFYESGVPKTKGRYEKNNQVGLWEYFYENNKPKASGQWKEKLQHGLWRYFYESGNLSSSGAYELGTPHGHWDYLFESGRVKQEGDFQNGRKEGIWKFYFEDGKDKASAYYQNDTGYYKELFPEGGTKSEGSLAGNKSFGKWRYYHSNGNLKATGDELNGKREGIWVFYHSNGNLLAEGQYNLGKQEGTWKYYHPDGKIASEGSMDQGQKEGIWKLYLESGFMKSELRYSKGSADYEEYYENGKLRVQGKIEKGKHEGLWKYFYDDGRIEGECDYSQGIGYYTGYYPEGKINMEGQLRNGEKIGMWKMFDSTGQIVGYYLAEGSREDSRINDMEEKQELETARPGLIKSVPTGQRIPRKRLPIRHFYSSANEFRSVVISSNPLSVFLNSAFVLVEYFMEQRLGYEFGYTWYRVPFFERFDRPSLERVYGQGFSIDVKQKFYSKKRSVGMLFFAHEPRYTYVRYSSRFENIPGNPESLAEAESEVQRYEYTLLLGYRIMRKTNQSGFVIDLFAGQSLGYRVVDQNWENNSRLDVLFNEVGETGFIFPFRLGFTVGYAF